MKTAVSLPDGLYKDAEKAAKDLGIPRSQLFARALEEFIQHHRKEGITEKLNEIYDDNEDLDLNDRDITILAMRELTNNDSW